MVRRSLRAAALAALLALACTPTAAQELGKSVGYLYYHGSFRERPLQVLVHGATYNHSYWDFAAVNGEAYSYARYMASPARKYAVLAIDQLASGESSRPANGLAVTHREESWVGIASWLGSTLAWRAR